MPKLIIFKNPEKKDHEKWYKGRNMMNIPHPSRILIIGKPNRGKTNIIKNLIFYALPKFKRVFLLHAASGQDNTIVPLDYQHFGVKLLSEIPDLDFWNNYEDEKIMLVVDDYNLKGNRKRLHLLERTFGFISTHKGVTCVLALQNGFDPMSIQFRRHCNLFIFFKTEDEKYNKNLAETSGLSRDKVTKIFKKYKFDIHDSLWIDFTANTPFPLRIIKDGDMKELKEEGKELEPDKDTRFLSYDRIQSYPTEKRHKISNRSTIYKPKKKKIYKKFKKKKFDIGKVDIGKFVIDLFKPTIKTDEPAQADDPAQ